MSHLPVPVLTRQKQYVLLSRLFSYQLDGFGLGSGLCFILGLVFSQGLRSSCTHYDSQPTVYQFIACAISAESNFIQPT